MKRVTKRCKARTPLIYMSRNNSLVLSTRDFKRASLEFESVLETKGFDELCYVLSVRFSTHGFKNELCHMGTVLVSTHGVKCFSLLDSWL